MKLFLILISSLFAVSVAADTSINYTVGISSAHPIATEAGHIVLRQGGNSFDAAVTISAVLAVVEPYSSGIGGGGFWLLHDAKAKNNIMLDGRETAPSRSSADMYLDDNNKVIPKLSIDGALSAGIPGVPAALDWLALNKGKLPLSITLQPAIDLAKKGFKVDSHYQKMMSFRIDAIRNSRSSKKIFLRNNKIPKKGTVIKQLDLANTLQQIANIGKAGFYKGDVAQKLVDGVNIAGGIWTLDDLKDYKIKVRDTIQANYKGMKITSAALPSSGGIVLSQVLNILQAYDLHSIDFNTQIHLISEAMRRSYRDRAEFLGDSDFVDVPVKRLIDPKYADILRQSIDLDKATASSTLGPKINEQSAGLDTTHFSVIDKEGNRVAATLSINYPFGSGFVPEGTGVLLNDEMDDFSSKPGVPNVYGLVGAKANSIEPNKRMLSSMSPTFLETEDRIAILGTPGGSRIISMVILASLGFYEGSGAEQIVNIPRFHHQYLPDRIQFEANSFSKYTQNHLIQLGHQIDEHENTWGNMQIVIKNKKTGEITAASDKRGTGKASVRTLTTR